MTTSGKRALAAVVIILLLAVIAGAYLMRSKRAPVGSGAGAQAKQPGLLDMLPPDAPIIAYGDLAALRSSSLGPALASLGDPRFLDPDYARFIRETGFDYTRDLDRVALAAWPPAAGKGGSAAGGQDVVLLAVAEGRFDRTKIAAYAQRSGRVTQHGASVIYVMSSGKPGVNISLTFLGADRIAISQGMPLDTIVDPSNYTAQNPALESRIARVAGSTFFAVARANDLASASGIPELQTGPMRKSIDSIQTLTIAGQPDADKITISAEGQCDSLPHALQLMAVLEGLRWVGRAALASAKDKHQIDAADAATLDKLLAMAAVSRSEDFVRVRVDLTSDFLQNAADNKAPPSPLHR